MDYILDTAICKYIEKPRLYLYTSILNIWHIYIVAFSYRSPFNSSAFFLSSTL